MNIITGTPTLRLAGGKFDHGDMRIEPCRAGSRAAERMARAFRAMGRPVAAALLVAMALALEFTSGCDALDPARPPQPAPRPGMRIVGYVAGWEKPAPDTSPSASKAMDGRGRPPIAAEKLTAINYVFAHVVDGRVALDQEGASAALTGLRGLKLRNPRLQILVSVGGWGADGFSDAALTQSSRTRFAESASKLIVAQQLDGIDIDWEYPGLPGPGIAHRAEDRRNFTLLLETLRRRLDSAAEGQGRASRHYLITAALADGEFVAHVELDRIHEYLDWLNLMTYDFHNSLTATTGHHAALSRSATSGADERSVEKAVDQFLAAGVPRDKLVVGVPFYGRAFADVRDENHGLDQPYGRYEGDHPWPQLVADFIGKNGFVRYWDRQAQVPYLWNARTRSFVSYDDPQSLALKARFVKMQRLGGVMYWEQSQDPDGELLGVLARVLQ
ncbi:MAG TPA: glycoside hydrolase family 18 protein [Rudaea sp.]